MTKKCLPTNKDEINQQMSLGSGLCVFFRYRVQGSLPHFLPSVLRFFLIGHGNEVSRSNNEMKLFTHL